MKKLLLSLLLIGMAGCAKGEIVGKYEFPITVKSEEWNELTRDEKVKMCQIPEDILTSMSSEALLLTILDYPYIGDIVAFSTIEIGFDHICDEFNGFREFIARKDCPEVVANQLSAALNDLDTDALRLTVLSILFHQDEIKSKIDVDKVNELEAKLEKL